MINFIVNLPLPLQFLLALLVPFVISLCIGDRVVNVLRAMKAGQPIREARKGVLAPEHQGKVGTPTMGGVMLIGSLLLTSVLFLDMADPRIQCCVFVTAVTALLGWLDDFAKITQHSTDGVSGWFKIAIQAVAATGAAFYLYTTLPGISALYVPFYGMLDIGAFFIPLALLVIIGSSNAVNLTDGLDGLASGCMMIASLAFIAILMFTVTATPAPVMLFLAAIMSACAGFLWFNCHPARMFMGDTGSLALGGALGTVAVCTQTELLLVVVGGVFAAEAVSVMIQVMWFKYTRITRGEGVRVFRMAPIHHHFEKGGLSETQVCVRFWIAALFLGALGLALSPVLLSLMGVQLDVSALNVTLIP
ncbi:MAG: phospho-N-acetylmuramoyl-pentapeptide-transferase [Akkermansia sp.]|nr:phospho-N-acetylmuramoyl-pentapeptide-transferase [Akkermansia sp.]